MLKIYKSSAGSGKTYTLVKEYIRLSLKSPSKFKHILALTFTNKAANEMKERILHTLGEIKNNTAAVAKLIPEIALEEAISEKLVIAKAAKVLSNILHNYSDFSIYTIDSFVHRIVLAFA